MMRHGQSCVCVTRARVQPVENSLRIEAGLTPFEARKTQFGLDEASVIALLRQQLKPGAFRLWRDRVHGRKTKHATMRLVALKGVIGSRRRGSTDGQSAGYYR